MIEPVIEPAIELVSARATARVDPRCGARLTSLVIDGVEVLIGGDPSRDDPLDWGLYPMVPFAGRVRRGEFEWRGHRYRLPRRREPHAIHGTLFDTPWTVERLSDRTCSMVAPLVEPWPFRGTVEHRLTLDDRRLELELIVHATVDMPVQVGWHPWFRKPARVSLPFRSIHRRDDDGIASPVARPIDPSRGDPVPGDADDCFTDLDGTLTIDVDGLELNLASSCHHWVVFDRLPHATCVEPQMGPPDVLSSNPVVIAAGTSHRETFTIDWPVSVRSHDVATLLTREGSRS